MPSFPQEVEDCAAIIVGWGSYMLIAGRARRMSFLRDARESVPRGAHYFTRIELEAELEGS